MAALFLVDIVCTIFIMLVFRKLATKVKSLQDLVEFQGQEIEDLHRGQTELDEAMQNMDSDLRNELADAGDVRGLENQIDSLQNQIDDLDRGE